MEVKKNLSAEAERVFTPSLRNEPELAIACVGVAVYQVMCLPAIAGQPKTNKRNILKVIFGYVPQMGMKRKINVRFVNYDKTTQLKSLKSNYIGTYQCCYSHSSYFPILTNFLLLQESLFPLRELLFVWAASSP